MQLDLKKKKVGLRKPDQKVWSQFNSFMSEGFKFEILTSLKKQF